jgi:hypothetical protein
VSVCECECEFDSHQTKMESWSVDIGFLQGLIADAKLLFAAAGGVTAFFVSLSTAPRTKIEYFAQTICRFHCSRLKLKCSPEGGAEFWIQSRSSKEIIDAQSIDFHFDKDEFMLEQRGEHCHPRIATVTYLSNTGAPTVVFDTTVQDVRDERNLNHGPCSAYVSFPHLGKHISFPGHLLHGCPVELILPAQGMQYSRLTLLVNLWLERAPSEIPRMPTSDPFSLLSPLDQDNPDVTFSEVRPPMRLHVPLSISALRTDISSHLEGGSIDASRAPRTASGQRTSCGGQKLTQGTPPSRTSLLDTEVKGQAKEPIATSSRKRNRSETCLDASEAQAGPEATQSPPTSRLMTLTAHADGLMGPVPCEAMWSALESSGVSSFELVYQTSAPQLFACTSHSGIN